MHGRCRRNVSVGRQNDFVPWPDADCLEAKNDGIRSVCHAECVLDTHELGEISLELATVLLKDVRATSADIPDDP
jgi:hypothetical protein